MLKSGVLRLQSRMPARNIQLGTVADLQIVALISLCNFQASRRAGIGLPEKLPSWRTVGSSKIICGCLYQHSFPQRDSDDPFLQHISGTPSNDGSVEASQTCTYSSINTTKTTLFAALEVIYGILRFFAA